MTHKLKEHLRRYDEWSCPDNLYPARRVLFMGERYPDRQGILRQAELDIKEEEHIRLQRLFDYKRVKMDHLVKRKYNWK